MVGALLVAKHCYSDLPELIVLSFHNGIISHNLSPYRLRERVVMQKANRREEGEGVCQTLPELCEQPLWMTLRVDNLVLTSM